MRLPVFFQSGRQFDVLRPWKPVVGSVNGDVEVEERQQAAQEIARQDGTPILRFSTDSPLRTTEGDLEAMALYAGQGTAFVSRKERAADVIDRIMDEAGAALDRVIGMAARRQEMRT